MPGGQINDTSSGKHYSLSFPPAAPSSPSRTLEGLFELSRRPSRALDLPRALLPELQRIKDTVRCATLGAEVPGHLQEQLTQTLIVCLLKTHLSSLYRKWGGALAPLLCPTPLNTGCLLLLRDITNLASTEGVGGVIAMFAGFLFYSSTIAY